MRLFDNRGGRDALHVGSGMRQLLAKQPPMYVGRCRGGGDVVHPEGHRPDGLSRSVRRDYARQLAISGNPDEKRQENGRLLYHVKKKQLLEFMTVRIGKSRSERGRKCSQKIRENKK